MTIEVRSNARVAAGLPLAAHAATLLSRSAGFAQSGGCGNRCTQRGTRQGRPGRTPRGNAENRNDSSQEPLQDHFGARHGPPNVTPRSSRRLWPTEASADLSTQSSTLSPLAPGRAPGLTLRSAGALAAGAHAVAASMPFAPPPRRDRHRLRRRGRSLTGTGPLAKRTVRGRTQTDRADAGCADSDAPLPRLRRSRFFAG